MESNIKVQVKGLSPLLLSRFSPPEEGAIPMKNLDPINQAVSCLYRYGAENQVGFPLTNLWASMINGGAYVKGKGRSTLAKYVAAAIRITPEWAPLTNDWEVDSRAVVMSNSGKGVRILRHRPRWDEWTFSFTIHFDPVLLTAKQVRDILEASGRLVGIGDYRPAKRGPFGRFEIVSFEEE